MIKKKKCKACGFKFRLEKENRYLAQQSTSPIGSLAAKPTIFEMFDCPNCGCQNNVGIYEHPIEEWQEVSEKEYQKEYSEFKK